MSIQPKPNDDTGKIAPPLLTLHLVATGLVRSHRYAEQSGTMQIPYGNELQGSLNRLLLASITTGDEAPSTVPELIAWCHRPLNTWGNAGNIEEITGQETLLVKGAPTRFCEEMACLTSPDVEADISEQRFMEAVMNQCRDENAPLTYVAFRSLLIDKPALTNMEYLERTGAAELFTLQAKLEEAYEPVPAALIADDGKVRLCAGCGNVLIPLQDGSFRCDEPDCDTGDSAVAGQLYTAVKDRPLRLKRGLRIFVTAPGRAERRLADVLLQKGIGVEMWPAFDRYDLRLTFTDGSVWAVDVKDWQNPYLLARKLGPSASIPFSPPWQRGFFVFPDRRRRQQNDYLRVIKGRCHFPANIVPCFERDFLRSVAKKLREIKEKDHA